MKPVRFQLSYRLLKDACLSASQYIVYVLYHTQGNFDIKKNLTNQNELSIFNLSNFYYLYNNLHVEKYVKLVLSKYILRCLASPSVSSTFNSSNLHKCEFIKFFLHQNFLAYGI